MSENISIPLIFNWRRPFASAYFRSASSYLGLKLLIFSLAGLAGQYLLTHYLAVADYGLLVWIGTIIALLSPFGLPGISTSITGAVAKGFDGNFRRGTWLEMAGGTLGGLVLLGFAGYYWFWTHEITKALIFIVAGVLGPGLWLDTHQCFWNGKKNFKAIFWSTVPARLLQLLSTAVVLYYTSNLLWVFSMQQIIFVAANIGAVLWIIRDKNTNKNLSNEYHSFGIYSTNLYWLGSVVAYLDKLIIGVFFGLESLAVFAVGELIYTYFYKTPASLLSQVFLPRLAEMEVKQAARWVRDRQKFLIIVTVLIVTLIGIAIPYVYPILFSTKYTDSVFYAYLFMGCIVLGAPTLLSGTLLKAHAMKKETTMGWMILCITPLIFIPLLGWLFGIAGIVMARGVTNAAISIYYTSMLNRLV